jgi:hypothetical protein
VSRAALIDAYVSALPFTPVAVVAIPGGGCRVETAAQCAPGETIAKQYYFKPSHIELVLGAAGLADGPIRQPPAVVAALIERTARRMHAPYETEPEIRAAAKIQVDAITERVKASGQRGALKVWNTRYRQYRLAQVAKAEKAIPYSAFLEQFVVTPTVRQIAASGRMI